MRRPIVIFSLFITLAISLPNSSAKIYKYKNKDGTLRYTDTPANLSDKSEQAGQKVSNDIAKQLNQKLQPQKMVEKAALGVVTIKTSLGHGSGFFLTDNGYIVTNKHVIRLTDEVEKHRKTFHANTESKIESFKKRLDEEEKKLADFKQRVDDYKKYLDSLDNPRQKSFVQKDYAAALKQYKSWLKDFNRREKTFKKQVESYKDQKRARDHTISISNLNQNFTIYLADNSKHYVYLVAISPKHDLALLKLNGYKTPYLVPADQASLHKGQPLFAIGNPATLKNSVSAGILSGREGGFIKTDAKIYPGNSGGPLINEDGKVVGINTFKKLTHKFEGLGFALPIHLALEAFRSYLK